MIFAQDAILWGNCKNRAQSGPSGLWVQSGPNSGCAGAAFAIIPFCEVNIHNYVFIFI